MISYVVSGFSRTVISYVMSGFSRTVTVRLKADTTYVYSYRSASTGLTRVARRAGT